MTAYDWDTICRAIAQQRRPPGAPIRTRIVIETAMSNMRLLAKAMVDLEAACKLRLGTATTNTEEHDA